MNEPPPPLHPECAKMHRDGYCVCTMVACMDCETNHPPHKECPRALVGEPLKAKP